MPSSSFENLRTIPRLRSHLEVHRVVEVRVGKESLIVDEDLDQKQGGRNVNQADFPSLVVGLRSSDISFSILVVASLLSFW